MQEVEIFEQEIMNGDVQIGKITVFRFITPNQELTRQTLHNAVTEYVGNVEFNQFVEIYRDNPAYRIIIKGIDELAFEPYRNQSL